MLTKVLFASVVLLSACIEDGVEGTPGSLPTEETTPAEPDVGKLAREQDQLDQVHLCDLLPTDDGACAHACDADALRAYVPAGTCASFACPLADGTTYHTGACN
jgi:hypothetical protein